MSAASTTVEFKPDPDASNVIVFVLGPTPAAICVNPAFVIPRKTPVPRYFTPVRLTASSGSPVTVKLPDAVVCVNEVVTMANCTMAVLLRVLIYEPVCVL